MEVMTKLLKLIFLRYVLFIEPFIEVYLKPPPYIMPNFSFLFAGHSSTDCVTNATK